ncbi:MAG: TRAP transporter small permease [Deltaproteobacteria bacterium]|nr:TRAP transporter small permease [Deltaproteobacteria bacterium]
MIQKVVRIWDKLEEILIVILISVASYLSFQEVILRSVFNTGWSGSYEITIMALIWCTFIGVSLGIKKNVHIGVDLLVNKFPPPIKKLFVYLSILCCLIFGIVIAFQGYQFTAFISRSHLLSRDLRIPMEWAYMSVPVCGVLVTLRFIEKLVYVIQGKTFEHDKISELSEEEKKLLTGIKKKGDS